MSYDIKFLKKYPLLSDSKNYNLLNRKEKRSFNSHNNFDKRYTDYINNVKYSKDKELKAMYHGSICESMLRKHRKLTNDEKQSIYKDCVKMLK
jgi:hypothetical protein